MIPLILLIVAIAIYLWCGVNLIVVSRFTVTSHKLPKSFDGYKIVQITDLHSKVFGHDNQWLIDKIDAIGPDSIVVTGDMMSDKNDDGQVFERLAAVLVKRYPIYCISGNHEERVHHHDANHIYADFRAKLINMGVHYIDNEKVRIARGGDSIDLYGLSIGLFFYRQNASKRSAGRYAFTKDKIAIKFGRLDESKFNLLLVHSPFYFDSYATWGADLTFAGHVHGGVIRLPFVGGVFSPDKTFFTKYDAGLFDKGDSKMIVGRGLGTTHLNVRIFNQPEIVVVTLNTTDK